MQQIINVAAMAMALAFAASDGRAEEKHPGTEQRTGFYLVLAEAPSAKSLPAATADQQVVRYDYHLVQHDENQAVRYLLLPKRPSVALLLAKAPAKEMGLGGRTQLLLELTPDAATRLEALTRDSLGKQVAFVVDDDVVSIHKIRSVITDGRFRVSRCTDNACEYIYGRLVGQ